jgi:hypothetical protein
MATVRGSVPLSVLDRFLRGVIRTLPPNPANARYTRTLLILEA